jgi:hypothetical protein
MAVAPTPAMNARRDTRDLIMAGDTNTVTTSLVNRDPPRR